MYPAEKGVETQRLTRILSFGAGAIGTYIGGSLAQTGRKVVFLERPEVAETLNRRGLHLTIDGQHQTIPDPIVVTTYEDAIGYAPFDLAIFALKSYDTHSALENLKEFQKYLPPILCLQNGVDNEPILESTLGVDHVIAGTVTSAIGRRAAGDIILERKRGIGIADGHPLSGVCVKVLNDAGLNAQLYASASNMKWSKLLTNLPANASSAILNMSPGEIFNHPGLFELEIRQLRETLAVMQAQKISAINLPGTPVRLFAWAIRYLPLTLSRRVLQRAIGSGRGGKMPSFHIDLHSGRGKSEVTYLNGAVADYGESFRVPTPVNRFLNDTLLALTQGKLPLNTYAQNPNKFLEDSRRF